MSGYVILEIIICFAFIFLLYSLLATIVVEMIVTALHLRAWNLRRAIRRMLQDDHLGKAGFVKRIFHFFLPRFTEKELVRTFFQLPHIKYMGKNKLYRTPSYMEPADFSKAMIDILASDRGRSEMESIESTLKYSSDFDKKHAVTEEEWQAFQAQLAKSDDPSALVDSWLRGFNGRDQISTIAFDSSDLHKLKELVVKEPTADKVKILGKWKKKLKPELQIDPETRFALSSLYKDAGGDLNQFKTHLESWFNSMMDRSKGWYKQRITLVNLVVGFAIAWSFNLDAIQIFTDLKTNTAHRNAILLQAETATASEDMKTISDSLRIYTTNLNQTLAGPTQESSRPGLGWLLTAIAISFGAPFWFDLLNKFMKLRTSVAASKGDPPPAEKPEAAGKSTDTFRDAKG